MAVYALGAKEPTIDPDAYVSPEATVIGDVTIAAGASVWPGAVLRADYGRIEIGAPTSIQDGTVLHTTAEWPTVIGADCVVGHVAHLEGCTVEDRCLIGSGSVAHLEGCTVEDRCLIGSGSVVLNRARIGTLSVVGAQALVPEDLVVPSSSIALGVPVRIRPVDPGVQASWIDFAVKEYVENARTYRDNLRLIEPGKPQGAT
jgi:carbonic anhydrase/acetyltransferase-like protein (isoleucine patch superfamily)